MPFSSPFRGTAYQRISSEALKDALDQTVGNSCSRTDANRKGMSKVADAKTLGLPRASFRGDSELVEAAGVEPASEGVTGKATPCSASSEFSPRRLEKRQNGGGATPNGFRRSVRGSGPATPAFGVGARDAAGALLGHRHCALITQRERDCCYWQLSFFTFFTRWVRPRHATFRVLVPVEAVSPPRARSVTQRSGEMLTR